MRPRRNFSQTLKDVEIPVISEHSSREELLRYIDLLEQRLEVSHVFEFDRDDPDPDHRFGLRKRILPQEERVAMLRRGSDAIFGREIAEVHASDEADALARQNRLLRRQLNLARRFGRR